MQNDQMASLDSFARRVEAELARGERPSQSPAEVAAYMAEFIQRHAHIHVAASLMANVILAPASTGAFLWTVDSGSRSSHRRWQETHSQRTRNARRN